MLKLLQLEQRPAKKRLCLQPAHWVAVTAIEQGWHTPLIMPYPRQVEHCYRVVNDEQFRHYFPFQK